MSRRTAQRRRRKKEMSHFEKFVTEGNERADEMAKEGALLEKEFMAEARTETMQERVEVYEGLQHAASFYCSVEEWKDCEEAQAKAKRKMDFCEQEKRGNEASDGMVCAEANKFRCMRCGRGSKYMKVPGTCTGVKYLSVDFGKRRKRHLGGHALVRRMGQAG